MAVCCRAWGGSFDTIYKPQFIDNFALQEPELQPIKFQGQSLDTETGLHYNRFRYYDSDVGMFIQRDPIELLGGFNVFAYAPNPVMWIDPWGLSQTYWLDKALATAERPVGAGQTAHHIVKFSSNQNEYSRASKGILDRAGIDIDPHCQNSCHPHPNNLNGGKGDNHGTIQSRTQTSNTKQTAIA